MVCDVRRTEVALKRLVHACEQQAALRPAGAGGDAWCVSPQARHAVDTAQQHLQELQAAGCVTRGCDAQRARRGAALNAAPHTPVARRCEQP